MRSDAPTARERFWYAAGIVVLLVASVLNARGLLKALDVTRKYYTYEDTDFPPTLIPSEQHPYDSVMYIENSIHYGLNDTAEWESLFPDGNGFVWLGPKGRMFGISMYTQLHCLNQLRVAVLRDPVDENEKWHTQHCFNHLRQMILCASQLKMEGVIKHYEDGKLKALINGQEYEHQCRDWTQLREAVEDNYQTWDVDEDIAYYA